MNYQKVSEAQKALAAKEQMLAIVSHDIKNPLSAIQLEAQMLLRAVERSPKSLLSEEVKIQTNRILKTTERLKILISDLLDKNKSENSLKNLKKEYVDAGKLLQEVVDSVRPHLQEKDILLKLSLPTKGSWALIDRNKMFQVFSNLLNNAIKFTPPKGMIHLLMEEVEHELIFRVVDSGPGVGEMELPCIFEKYWSGSNAYCPGTGLGLFICKTVIEAHGGYITVENVPEGGAQFYFSIPKNQQSVIDKSLDKRKKIYILDDDEDLREVMSWALGKEGYSIHSFHSPTEALDCLMKGRNLPHLMVVDYHMEEMKGSEFLLKKDEIQEARSCPVLMISASPCEYNGKVVAKPIDLEALVSNVKELLLQ